MMKILALIALVTLLAFPGYGFGQALTDSSQMECPNPSPNPDKTFCEKDPRPRMRAFCDKLADLLSYAKANPKADSQCFRPFLRNLDLTANLDQKLNRALP